MPPLPALLRRLPTDPRPDGDLLAAFRAHRDDAAFAELVRRHGPLVWGVCRRLLPDPADAEDAFQATFLVLVRRSGSLTRSPAVGPWLYRVAAWTARNLRRKNARHFARRRPLIDGELGTLTGAARREPEHDLDAALLALPAKYRDALVLCHLQGRTRREAAAQLGVPEGTLSAWLSRGLAKLRTDLTAPAVAVPAALAAATTRAAGATLLASAGSPAVVHLVEGVVRMFWLKKAAASTLAAVLLIGAGVGVGVSVRPTPAGADDRPKAAGAEPPVNMQQLRESLAAAKASRDKAKADAEAARKQYERAAQTATTIERGVVWLEGQIRQMERLRGEPPAQSVEIVVGGADRSQRLTVLERAPNGDVSLATNATDAAGLRLHLSRVKADPKSPQAAMVSVAKLAKWAEVAAVLKACKEAGYGGGIVSAHPEANVHFANARKLPGSETQLEFEADDFGVVTVGPKPPAGKKP